MAVNIKDPATEKLVRQLAAETGESITAAVAGAVEERLERLRGSRSVPDLAADLMDIASRVSRLPVLDDRGPEEILGYGPDGLAS